MVKQKTPKNIEGSLRQEAIAVLDILLCGEIFKWAQF